LNAAPGAQLFLQDVTRFLVEVGDHNPGAFGDKALHYAFANPRRAAGNDCNLAFKLVCHEIPLLFSKSVQKVQAASRQIRSAPRSAAFQR
jgi:hypothetical protein